MLQESNGIALENQDVLLQIESVLYQPDDDTKKRKAKRVEIIKKLFAKVTETPELKSIEDARSVGKTKAQASAKIPDDQPGTEDISKYFNDVYALFVDDLANQALLDPSLVKKTIEKLRITPVQKEEFINNIRRATKSKINNILKAMSSAVKKINKERRAAKEVEQARKEAAVEQARKAAEEAEQARKAAEEAEQARLEAEQARKEAEQARKEAEQVRLDAEQARKEAEAEQARKEAEQARLEAEQVRKEAKTKADQLGSVISSQSHLKVDRHQSGDHVKLAATYDHLMRYYAGTISLDQSMAGMILEHVYTHSFPWAPDNSSRLASKMEDLENRLHDLGCMPLAKAEASGSVANIEGRWVIPTRRELLNRMCSNGKNPPKELITKLESTCAVAELNILCEQLKQRKEQAEIEAEQFRKIKLLYFAISRQQSLQVGKCKPGDHVKLAATYDRLMKYYAGAINLDESMAGIILGHVYTHSFPWASGNSSHLARMKDLENRLHDLGCSYGPDRGTSQSASKWLTPTRRELLEYTHGDTNGNPNELIAKLESTYAVAELNILCEQLKQRKIQAERSAQAEEKKIQAERSAQAEEKKEQAEMCAQEKEQVEMSAQEKEQAERSAQAKQQVEHSGKILKALRQLIPYCQSDAEDRLDSIQQINDILKAGADPYVQACSLLGLVEKYDDMPNFAMHDELYRQVSHSSIRNCGGELKNEQAEMSAQEKEQAEMSAQEKEQAEMYAQAKQQVEHSGKIFEALRQLIPYCQSDAEERLYSIQQINRILKEQANPYAQAYSLFELGNKCGDMPGFASELAVIRNKLYRQVLHSSIRNCGGVLQKYQDLLSSEEVSLTEELRQEGTKYEAAEVAATKVATELKNGMKVYKGLLVLKTQVAQAKAKLEKQGAHLQKVWGGVAQINGLIADMDDSFLLLQLASFVDKIKEKLGSRVIALRSIQQRMDYMSNIKFSGENIGKAIVCLYDKLRAIEQFGSSLSVAQLEDIEEFLSKDILKSISMNALELMAKNNKNLETMLGLINPRIESFCDDLQEIKKNILATPFSVDAEVMPALEVLDGMIVTPFPGGAGQLPRQSGGSAEGGVSVDMRRLESCIETAATKSDFMAFDEEGLDKVSVYFESLAKKLEELKKCLSVKEGGDSDTLSQLMNRFKLFLCCKDNLTVEDIHNYYRQLSDMFKGPKRKKSRRLSVFSTRGHTNKEGNESIADPGVWMSEFIRSEGASSIAKVGELIYEFMRKGGCTDNHLYMLGVKALYLIRYHAFIRLEKSKGGKKQDSSATERLHEELMHSFMVAEARISQHAEIKDTWQIYFEEALGLIEEYDSESLSFGDFHGQLLGRTDRIIFDVPKEEAIINLQGLLSRTKIIQEGAEQPASVLASAYAQDMVYKLLDYCKRHEASEENSAVFFVINNQMNHLEAIVSDEVKSYELLLWLQGAANRFNLSIDDESAIEQIRSLLSQIVEMPAPENTQGCNDSSLNRIKQTARDILVKLEQNEVRFSLALAAEYLVVRLNKKLNQCMVHLSSNSSCGGTSTALSNPSTPVYADKRFVIESPTSGTPIGALPSTVAKQERKAVSKHSNTVSVALKELGESLDLMMDAITTLSDLSSSGIITISQIGWLNRLHLAISDEQGKCIQGLVDSIFSSSEQLLIDKVNINILQKLIFRGKLSEIQSDYDEITSAKGGGDSNSIGELKQRLEELKDIIQKLLDHSFLEAFQYARKNSSEELLDRFYEEYKLIFAKKLTDDQKQEIRNIYQRKLSEGDDISKKMRDINLTQDPDKSLEASMLDAFLARKDNIAKAPVEGRAGGGFFQFKQGGQRDQCGGGELDETAHATGPGPNGA